MISTTKEPAFLYDRDKSEFAFTDDFNADAPEWVMVPFAEVIEYFVSRKEPKKKNPGFTEKIKKLWERLRL